jgi:glycosyltransferase involved in cell wall biosynthesis
MGVEPLESIRLVGNGVDAEKFFALPKSEAPLGFGLPDDAKVFVTVGGLVERKGFHRVRPLLPGLRTRHPTCVT